MQQKAQIIATLLHKPDLLIVDEPFSGLDPLNTQLVKDLLREQHQQGVTIILCSHQMNLVEELCERIVLIDHGRTVLYGSLDKIRRRFSGHAVSVQTRDTLPSLPRVERIETINGSFKLHLAPGSQPQEVLRLLVEQNINLDSFKISVPTLDEIFIRVVKNEGEGL